MKRSNDFLFSEALNLVRERGGQTIVELSSIRSAGSVPPIALKAILW